MSSHNQRNSNEPDFTDISVQCLVNTHSVSREVADQVEKIANEKISEKNAAVNAAIARRKNVFRPDTINSSENIFIVQADQKIRVCLVTDEISTIGPSGGIGAAFLELARLLAQNSQIQLTLLYTNFWVASDPHIQSSLKRLAQELCSDLYILDPAIYVNAPFEPHKVSYAVYQYLRAQVAANSGNKWDVIHFHDYKGIGYFTALRNKQKPQSVASSIVVQTHGTSRWAIELNGRFFSDESQLMVDYLETSSIQLCDTVVSPSQYLLDWFLSRNIIDASEHEQKRKVIQNIRVASPHKIEGEIQSKTSQLQPAIEEIIFFGRHEARKGLPIFVDAINHLIKEKTIKLPSITILGGLGTIGEIPSLLYLENATKGWDNLNFKLILNYNRDQSIAYLSNRAHTKLVCICSPAENSPYTLVEAVQSGCMLICSDQGGGRELVNEHDFSGIIDMKPENLSNAIQDAFINPSSYLPKFQFSDSTIEKDWLDLHFAHQPSHPNQLTHPQLHSNFIKRIQKNELPLISFVITHYERPQKLSEALASVLLQTYPHIQIIIVDDGSSNKETLEYLNTKIEPLLRLCKGKLIHRSNGYLGAARNTGLQAADGEYIIFMDDDDIALPNLVSTLVEATINNPNDVTIALNTYMPLSERESLRAQRFESHPIPSYIPIGNIKSLTPLQNVIGACTSLIKLDTIKAIRGYSELRNVGHEDYELYVKLSQAGYKFQICPEVLYLYETQRPSMLSKTTLWMNYERSIKAHGLPQDIEDLILCFKGQYIEKIRPSRLAWILQDESLGNYIDDWMRVDKAVAYMQDRLNKSGSNPALLNALTPYCQD